jgi:hypothetical protein
VSAVLPDPSLTRVYRLEATLGEPLDLGDLAQDEGRDRHHPPPTSFNATTTWRKQC